MRVVAGVILDRPEYYAPFYYDNKYHNPIGILSGDNAMGQGLLKDYNGFDALYADHSNDFKYVKVENPFYVKYQAIVLAFAYFSSVTGLDFEKSLEINTVDNGNSYDPTSFDDLDQFVKDSLSGVEDGDTPQEIAVKEATAKLNWEQNTEVVVDPLSKKTYFAANIYNVEPASATSLAKVSIGYELLKDFKVLTDKYNLAKADYDADENDTAKYEAFDTARKALREKRNYIDLVVKMMFYFKHHDY